MGEVSTREAAERLGVSVRQVERLVASGRLVRVRTVGSAFTVDEESVARVLRQGSRRGRTASIPVAWAALDLLSGGSAHWLESSVRSRLRRRLREMSPDEVAYVVSGRAVVRRYRGSRRVVEALSDRVLVSGQSAVTDPEVAGRFGLPPSVFTGVEGYVNPQVVAWLLAQFPVEESASGSLILRVTTIPDGVGAAAPDAAVAVDLMESAVRRERDAGAAMLGELLRGF